MADTPGVANPDSAPGRPYAQSRSASTTRAADPHLYQNSSNNSDFLPDARPILPRSLSHSRQNSAAVKPGPPGPSPHGASHSAAAGARDPWLQQAPLANSTASRPGGLAQEKGLERRPSYNHHRQTSVVHGKQHSRNPSFANSPATSPLGPEIIDERGEPTGEEMADPMLKAGLASAGNASPLPNGGLDGGRGHRATTSATAMAMGLDGNASDGGNNQVNHNTQRRVDRMHSSKVRRDQSHHRSQSRNPQDKHQTFGTVGEYALAHLFHSFTVVADHKINQCTANLSEPEPRVDELCGPDVDPNFDQLIKALAHVARDKPKPLIDTLMFWRKGKSDAASNARLESQVPPAPPGPPGPRNPTMPRRNTEPPQGMADSSNPGPGMANSASAGSFVSRQDFVLQAERQSTVAIYLLCRVLMVVLGQSTLAVLGVEMMDRLEDIIFGQLKATDPDHVTFSPLKAANWRIFSQLLGVMSGISFHTVTDRFLKEIRRLQKEWDVKNGLTKENESRLHLIIMGMKHVQIKTETNEAWHLSCDYLHKLSRYFASSHGQRIKHAYCQIFEKLLLQVAATRDVDLSTPQWKIVLDVLGSRVNPMAAKPRHWLEAYPVAALLPCVSTSDSFVTQWNQMLPLLQSKLKDRTTRGTALRALARLLWTYLYRPIDPAGMPTKKLEESIRLVLVAGRKSYLTTDPAVSEPMIQIMRIIGFKHQELCFKTMIFPLINSEYFTSGKELKVDQLEPEKIVIGIRAFLVIMADLERGVQGKPPFPQVFSQGLSIDRNPAPSTTPSPKVMADSRGFRVREERLSRPVLTMGLSDVARDYYARFCGILGQITMICDNTFGGQAVLDEKFALTPKTPIAETFSFGRRDEHQALTEQKQGYYDLLHVAVQALPRCLTPEIPFNPLVNLLCTGTAHVQSQIAFSSAQSLKSIARQGFAQSVTVGFARFIFNFDDRYSTMSDGGMLGPGHIENTLKLYVELLQIWMDEIKRKTKEAGPDSLVEGVSSNRGVQLDLSGVWAYVDEIESHGLFFLCSQSRRVRSFAVTVLRLITEFDKALGKDNTRIIHVMENESLAVMDFNDEQLSVAERSRLQRGLRNSNSQDTLIELCSSEISYDSTLWIKVFPNLIRLAFQRCPFATTLGRVLVSDRLAQMHRSITAMSETQRGAQGRSYDALPGRAPPRPSMTPPEVTIEQWKLYLIVTCSTLNNAGSQQNFSVQQNAQHTRKTSKPAHQGHEKVGSAKSLFQSVIDLLSVGPSSIREAVVLSLGSINVNLYRILLESLTTAVVRCNDEARQRIHQRTVSSPRRNARTDRLRTEITHVYKLTCHFLREESVYTDDWILHNLVTYTNDLKIFLSDVEVQNDWELQKLRRHYCGLMEELFEGINRTKDPARWMSFEARKSSFHLMEDWCGYSPNQSQIREREDRISQSVVDQQREVGDRRVVTAAMEIEKRNLKTAALSAMAALCGGPVTVTTDRKQTLHFDVRRMLSWVDAIFSTPSDRLHMIGRRALTNLITHNLEHPFLLERTISMCYQAGSLKALESYFDVVTQVLKDENVPIQFWKILGAILFILGNDDSALRSRSLHLLRTLEERRYKTSKIQDYDISVSDKTTAVYKLAQFEISKRLAKQQHPDLAFYIFSEYTNYFKMLEPKDQRNMVATILPWIQTVELQIDPTGGPTAHSYMLLANLFEITIRSSGSLHNEVQALWQALATGPHAGNVQFVLDFIISLCLDKREQNFVDYAKQIVVFLSSTPAGLKVVEFLIMQINPRAMVQEKPKPLVPPPEALQLPYLADLSLVLPVGNKQSGFSLGHLSLILLVDLMVSPVQLPVESVTLLLQIVFVLWDHYIPVVQDQAREMLIHLIHELVLSKVDREDTVPSKKSIEDLVEEIRRNDTKVVWAYDDSNVRDEQSGRRVLQSMHYLSGEVIGVFALTYPTIRESWGKTTLNWATSCTVRHLACRSFQIFRCILSALDDSMLADMLARLSNTIAADELDVQTFSMEILTTLKTIIAALSPSDLLKYPQLFWATCACLNTIHEREFMESLEMLELFMEKVNIADPEVVQLLGENLPARWNGAFEGIQPLIYRGLRSDQCLDRTLNMLGKMTFMRENPLIGNDNRLVFSVLANMPRLLQSVEDDDETLHNQCVAAAEGLANSADAMGLTPISSVLRAFVERRYRNSNDLLIQSAQGIRESFFPEWDYQSLVFLLGLLSNRLPWMKIRTMQLLCELIPNIDLRKPEIASHGPDLIAPVLRLLQTPFCNQALEILDHVTSMPGTPMDPQMGMGPGIGMAEHSRAMRNQYERTQNLFGIPEESGWAIPMAAAHSTTTRSNVHSVFYTCANPESMRAGTAATPDLEFHADDFGGYGFPPFPADRTATMMSDDMRAEGNMGELVSKLDSLDDLFDFEDDDPVMGSPAFEMRSTSTLRHMYEDDNRDLGPPAIHTPSGARYEPPPPMPAVPRHHLSRTGSVASIHGGAAGTANFSESRNPSTARERGVMSPTAFIAPHHPSRTLPRPRLHSRSVTSPATNQASAHQHQPLPSAMASGAGAGGSAMGLEFLSDDEHLSDAPSEDGNNSRPHGTSDPPTRNGGGGGSSFSIGNVIRPVTQSTRAGVRRLTGGSRGGNAAAAEKDRQQAQQLQKDNSHSGNGTGLTSSTSVSSATSSSSRLERNRAATQSPSPKVPKVPDIYLQGAPPGAGGF
ncbi:MAG: hypothetical protein M4579_004826 [Chaenotheca gracillima]|nr:MAG: hypothetical protein M4579_004826 [Chaenotheca gracillima]